MRNLDAHEPTEIEVERLVNWLSKGLEPGVKKKAALAAAAEALCRLRAGRLIESLDAETIADRAGAGGQGADSARRWVNQQLPVRLLLSRLEQQKTWLRDKSPDATHAVLLLEHRSSGGRGHRKTYQFTRVPLLVAAEGIEDGPATRPDPEPLELEASPDASMEAADPDVIHYEMTFCDRASLTRWARFIFRSNGVEKTSWRWRLLAARFVTSVLLIGLMLVVGVLLPLLSRTTFHLSLSIVAIGFVALVYWTDIRPWVRIVDDRIRMAGDTLISDFRPAQLEIWRDGERSIWRIVRYTATCPICVATVEVQPGEPDLPRRLVGRCAESPREHVFSFDRITRRGRALIAPPD